MAKYDPADFPLMKTAKVIVGCSSEEAQKVYFDHASITDPGRHTYIAFFDEDGEKIGEVKVIEDDQQKVIFDDLV